MIAQLIKDNCQYLQNEGCFYSDPDRYGFNETKLGSWHKGSYYH